MATTIVTKNSSTAAAVPTAAQLVQGELAVNVADKRIYTEDSVGGIVELGTNPSAEIVANGGIALPDNGKATFGAGDDLQIYHDGFNTYIKESGAGSFLIDATNTYFRNAAGTKDYAWMVDGGAVSLFHNNAAKLATTATGIDVTGTATMDGLVVSNGTNTTAIPATSDRVSFTAGSSFIQSTGALFVQPAGDLVLNGTGAEIMRLKSGKVGIGTSSPTRPLTVNGNNGTGMIINDAANDKALRFRATGDAFYIEATNNAESAYANLALAGNVGIGTNSPIYPLVVSNSGAQGLEFVVGTTNFIQSYNRSTADYTPFRIDAETIAFATDNGSERMRIDSAGNVGVGTSSPASTLEIAKNDQTNGATLSITNSHDGAGWTAGDTVGSIDFRIDDGSAPEKVSGQIKVFDDTSVSTTYPAYSAMSFSTSLLGTFAERMRISSAGVVEFKGGITEAAVTLTGTATTINLATATNFVHALTGATTYTFSNPAVTGNVSAFTLKIIQDSTARTITWPSSVDWPGGTAPTLTATSGGVDIFTFFTLDGGVTYYGFTAGQAMA